MENNTLRTYNPSGYNPQPGKLSFYEENYILDPNDNEESNWSYIDENEFDEAFQLSYSA